MATGFLRECSNLTVEEVEGILEAGDQVTVTFKGKVEYDNGITSGMASFEGSDVITVIETGSKKDKPEK